jgi:hypothetical protein
VLDIHSSNTWEMFLFDMLCSMKRQICPKDTVILDDSMTNVALIFVRHGRMVLKNENKALLSLERGSFLEIAVLHNDIIKTVDGQYFLRKNKSLVASSTCEYAIMNIDTFKIVTSKFPLVQKAYNKILEMEKTRYQVRLDAAKESALETERQRNYEKMMNLNSEFIQAATAGNVDKLKECIERGANIEFTNPKTGVNALFASCMARQLNSTKYLLQVRANHSTKNSNGQSPLHIACQSEWIDGVKILIEANADIEIRDDDGESLLHIAAVTGNPELLSLIIKFAKEKQLELSNLMKPDDSGRTPIDICSSIEGRKILKPKTTFGYNIIR